MSDAKVYKNIAKWNNTLQAANTGNPLLVLLFFFSSMLVFTSLSVNFHLTTE